MVGTLWLLDIGIASISSVLLLGILAVHLKSWMDIGSRILVGASAFVFLLLVGNVLAAYFSFLWAQSYGAGVALPILVMELLQVVGYSVFFVLSWKY
jgi:hypothetical protein